MFSKLNKTKNRNFCTIVTSAKAFANVTEQYNLVPCEGFHANARVMQQPCTSPMNKASITVIACSAVISRLRRTAIKIIYITLLYYYHSTTLLYYYYHSHYNTQGKNDTGIGLLGIGQYSQVLGSTGIGGYFCCSDTQHTNNRFLEKNEINIAIQVITSLHSGKMTKLYSTVLYSTVQ